MKSGFGVHASRRLNRGQDTTKSGNKDFDKLSPTQGIQEPAALRQRKQANTEAKETCSTRETSATSSERDGQLLPTLPPFNPDSDATSLAQRWTKWHACFENVLLAANVKDAAHKCVMLLHFASEVVYDNFTTLSHTGTDYEMVVARLTDISLPKRLRCTSTTFFVKCNKIDAEETDQFQLKLRRLAATCEFTNAGRELVSSLARRSCNIREADITLDKLMSISHNIKNAERQAASIKQPRQWYQFRSCEPRNQNAAALPQRISPSTRKQTSVCAVVKFDPTRVGRPAAQPGEPSAKKKITLPRCAEVVQRPKKP